MYLEGIGTIPRNVAKKKIFLIFRNTNSTITFVRGPNQLNGIYRRSFHKKGENFWSPTRRLKNIQ